MLDNIIGNEKAKFMTNYSKLTNELNDFISLNKKANGAKVENKNSSSTNRMNLLLKEKLITKKNEQNINKIFSNEKNVLDKNFFSEDVIKKEKWQNLKKAINTNSNKNTENTNSVFDRIKNNLDKMKKEFTLEEAFQKNLGNLNDLNIISPRNNILNNFTSKTSKISENKPNGISANDPILINTLNNSKNITSNLKYKFNQFYFNQKEIENNLYSDTIDRTQEK